MVSYDSQRWLLPKFAIPASYFGCSSSPLPTGRMLPTVLIQPFSSHLLQKLCTPLNFAPVCKTLSRDTNTKAANAPHNKLGHPRKLPGVAQRDGGRCVRPLHANLLLEPLRATGLRPRRTTDPKGITAKCVMLWMGHPICQPPRRIMLYECRREPSLWVPRKEDLK